MSPSVASSQVETDGKEVDLLNKEIAETYDEAIHEQLWGDQLHHGFYDVGDDQNDTVSLMSSRIRMIEEALRFAGFSDDGKKPEKILDVGCGIGGSSRHFAEKYGTKSKTIGISISPSEVHRAQALSDAQGFGDLLSFVVGDALDLPFPDGHFDLVWSLECGEHIADRAKFVSELVRVTAPGGTIVITVSCHRDLGPNEKSLKPDEKAFLDKTSKSLYLADWFSGAGYVNLLESLNVRDIKIADWSDNVAPFWPAVFRAVLSWEGVALLLQSEKKSQEFVMSLPMMYEGHKMGLIRYNIITCKKPE